MKPVMLYAIIAIAAIAIVAGFKFQLGDMTMPPMSEELASNILFVCPAKNVTWDSIAFGLRIFSRYIIGGFFFAAVLLLFGWGWQLYQNLLSDKFKRESFKNIWAFTKIWFWALVIATILLYTPNTFRRVNVTGDTRDWVLCDGNTPGMQAAPANLVHAH